MPISTLRCPYCGQQACLAHLDLRELDPYDDRMIAALEREETQATRETVGR